MDLLSSFVIHCPDPKSSKCTSTIGLTTENNRRIDELVGEKYNGYPAIKYTFEYHNNDFDEVTQST